ncbi:shikimate kinase [Tenggerimyces flavus]|uniref:Shikimate kinase n=1 Tax=Tenggerimyces flavus TaxID=1708749 RepID=A0ABV7YF30_9ACTN|nr:shikimate kinase [Tenggerimyces flavus]MBM7787940.1 shikimate kinase [Tenggerimyces flavus]
MSPRAVVVGPPGSGKTTIGSLLASRYEVEFRDTDADIEASAGASIADIFVTDGEPHFRSLERAAIAAALSSHSGVLSLGGGSVLDPATRALLAAERVVFLEVSLTDAAKRVGLDNSRPLLLGNVRGRLKQLMDARRPLYEEVATVVVDTSGRTPEDIVDEIVKALS